MTVPTSTHPTPSAVPWSPDMMAPQATPPAAPAPVQNFTPTQPQMQPAPQYQAPQPDYAQAPAPQHQPQHPVAPQPQPAFAPQPNPQVPQVQAQPQHMPSPQMGQPQMQPAQYAPVGHPPQQMAPPPAPQMAQHQHAPVAPAPQFQQAMIPPPLAPHMRIPQQNAPAHISDPAPAPSNSLFAKLLKRSPKPEQAETQDQMSAQSGSLFNKNFALGAVTGLVVGAFVLPMVLGLFGGDAPVQTQAQVQAPINTAPAATTGDTFIDNAIAADAP